MEQSDIRSDCHAQAFAGKIMKEGKQIVKGGTDSVRHWCAFSRAGDALEFADAHHKTFVDR